MGTIRIQGLGDYEIAGDVPTEAERQAMLQALAEKQAEQPVETRPPSPLVSLKTEDEDVTFWQEAMPQMVGGIRDAAQSALNLAVNRPVQWSGVSFFDKDGNYDLDFTPENSDMPFKPLQLPTVAPAETTGGNVVRTMSQFFVPYLGAMKIIGVGRGVLSNLARAEGAAILTEQVVFDPFDAKLADMVQEFPVLRNPITEYLQADEDDTEAEARFKLSIESAGLGAMFATISHTIKGLTRLKQGKTNEGLEEIDKGLKANPDVDDDLNVFDLLGENAPKSQVGDAAPVPTSDLRLDKYIGKDAMETGNLRNIIRSFAENRKSQIDKIVSSFDNPVHKKEWVLGTYKELGMTPEQIRSLREGAILNDRETVAARVMLAESAMNMHDLGTIATRSGSKADLLKVKDAVDLHTSLHAHVMGVKAEQGRAFRQWQYVIGANLDELLNMAGGADNLEDMARMLAALDPEDMLTMNKVAKTLNDPTLSDKWLEAWINGLLSGPQTHVVNILSNILTGVWSIPEQYLAAGIGALRRTPDRITFGEVNARAWGYLQGAREGISLAKKTFLTETPSDVFSKLEARREKAIKGPLGKFVRIPGRALMASDEFFKSIGYRMELNAQAYRSATKAGLRPNTREFAQHMRGIIDDLPIGKNQAETTKLLKARADELGMSVPALRSLKDQVNLKATDNARYLTFTKPLEGVSQHLTKAQAQMPALRLIAPFVRTPVNIVRFAAERTPFGMIMRENRGLKGAARDAQIAKMSLASMVGVSTVSMAAEGKITGSGPTDPAARARLRETGWQPYSFVIEQEDGTKRYLAYNRVEPLGIILGLSADFSDIAGSLGEEDRDSIGARISASITQNLTDKTFFKGITDAIEAVNDPDRFMDVYSRNMLGTLVPTALAQAARTADPVLRDTQSWMDRMKSRVPGYSEDLPARRNLWGQPIILSGGLGPDIISPIYSSFSKNDPVANELIRLEYYPSMPQRSLDGTEIPQDLYWKFVERAGKPAHRVLQGIVTSPEYKALGRRNLRTAQIDLIKKVMDPLRTAARMVLKIEMGQPLTSRQRGYLEDLSRDNPELLENIQLPRQ